ncbi:hypothetical protein SNE510_63100 [Streptomyces sp. NE5-10]|nr:hypothetical protein SNE510_63100 [Streptomyces sp. NE5-10]
MITTSASSWTAPFTGLSPRCFGKLAPTLRREGADEVRRGRPWGLPLEHRVLLVTSYWRTNLTLRQLAPLFGVPKSAAGRVIGHIGPCSRSGRASGSTGALSLFQPDGRTHGTGPVERSQRGGRLHFCSAPTCHRLTRSPTGTPSISAEAAGKRRTIALSHVPVASMFCRGGVIGLPGVVVRPSGRLRAG